ncbi:hypothetical protein C8Q76DRAFT_444501 [Earliella scabrosa]|nr:hypothetical protein C8Q76DRAFT_444501 [Earliella scabrosa]
MPSGLVSRSMLVYSMRCGQEARTGSWLSCLLEVPPPVSFPCRERLATWIDAGIATVQEPLHNGIPPRGRPIDGDRRSSCLRYAEAVGIPPELVPSICPIAQTAVLQSEASNEYSRRVTLVKGCLGRSRNVRKSGESTTAGAIRALSGLLPNLRTCSFLTSTSVLASVPAYRVANSIHGTADAALAFMRLCEVDGGHYRHAGDISRNLPWYVTHTRACEHDRSSVGVRARIVNPIQLLSQREPP